MALPSVLLYADLIDHLRFNYQGTDSDADLRDMRQAIQTAYREVTFGANWQYYYTRGRVQLNAAYSTGTVGVVASTGVVTLATGSWPTWAASGVLRIGNVSYPVLSRSSNSVITVDATYGPAADITSGTAYTLFQSNYPLPANFRGMNKPYSEAGKDLLCYISPDRWLFDDRNDFQTADAVKWTIVEDNATPGGFSVQVWPVPNAALTLDFIYRRAPRDLRITGFETNSSSSVGTIATSGTTVTGTGTTFNSSMVGSFLRIGTSTSQVPTGYGGNYPYTEQKPITTYSSATSMAISSAFTATVSGLKYIVSDPVDMWAGMQTALLRRMEMELAICRGKDVDRATALAEQALTLARENDASLNFSQKVTGEGEDSLAARNYVINS